MFDFILKYISGFTKFSVKGVGVQRFYNLCSKRDIVLWNIVEFSDHETFFINRKDMKKIEVPASKAGVELEILKEYGLKVFLRNNRKRIPFVVGFIMFAIIIYVQSLFIWDINISGETRYTKEEILSHVEKYYVSEGTLKSDIDCEQLEKDLRKDFDEIAWISCSIDGTRLNITLTETLDVFTDTSLTTPSNVVAVKDCTITSMITTAGTPVVEVGTDVKKGDILISGAVYLYDDNKELMDTHYVAAKGEILGLTEIQYSDSLELSYYKKEYSDNQKSYYRFGIFTYLFTPYVPDIKFDNFDTVSKEHKFHIGDSFYLPFQYEKITSREYELMPETYTEEEAKAKMEERLMQYISSLQEKGVQILENNVKIEITNNQCTASGTIKVCEPVGISKELEIISEDTGVE